jgi:K+-sensing histidine kinase KdpD
LDSPLIRTVDAVQNLLNRTHTNNPEQAKLSEVVRRNVKRLTRLSIDILDATRIESKLLELKKEEFNLNDVIINAMNDITLVTLPLHDGKR